MHDNANDVVNDSGDDDDDDDVLFLMPTVQSFVTKVSCLTNSTYCFHNNI